MIDPNTVADSLPSVSFMSANYLARESNYQNVASFGQGGASIKAVFSPASTYGERIDELFEKIASLGFAAVDLWTAHCNPEWFTPQHLKGLQAACERNGIKISSLAGGMGGDLARFEDLCRLSREIGCPTLGMGGKLLPAHLREVQQVLERYEVSLGFENHPNEKTSADVLEKIGNGQFSRVGSTLDTGWFATHGHDVIEAIEQLKNHLLLVHLKNIEQPGAHVAAPWKAGCLDFEPIVRKLKEVGYKGYISLEYEPLDHDPSEQCREAREQVEAWLAEPVSETAAAR